MWLYTRTAAGVALGVAVFGAISLVVVLTTVLWGGTRERADAHDLDDIYLGDLGIYHLGRYTPVRGMNLFLLDVTLQGGRPSVLQFTVGSRTRHGMMRPSDVRVLVPQGREGEAADVVARYCREFQLDGQDASASTEGRRGRSLRTAAFPSTGGPGSRPLAIPLSPAAITAAAAR